MAEEARARCALGGLLEGRPHVRPRGRGRAGADELHQSGAARQDAAAFADSGDLTLEGYKTLHALMIQPWPVEATPAQLADHLNITRAAVTSRLDRLAAADLVTRQVDETDRRRVLVRPTAAGRAAWNKYIFEGMAREQRMLGAFTVDELRQLNALLRKVVRSRES